MTVVSAPVMAQNTDQQVANITKVIMDNKSNLEAVEDQVKDFVKENKKNPLALAGLGRAFFDAKDTTSAKKYAEMAIDRGKNEAEGYILLGDIEAMKNDGGAAATWYQQATIMDPQEPQGYIKYASVYRKRSPELSVQMLEKLRTVDPSYPVDAEAGHFFYTIVILRQIWPDIDGFQHWFMDNGLVADRKLQKQRQSFVGHALVLTGTADMYIFIAIAPIIRQADGEALRPFSYKKEVQIDPLFHHRPGLFSPLVSCRVEKIRGKAGIYIIAVRLELIFSLPVLLYGQIERGSFGNDRSILAKLGIPPVHIAVVTAWADLRAAMPGIPCCHTQSPLLVKVWNTSPLFQVFQEISVSRYGRLYLVTAPLQNAEFEIQQFGRDI